MEQINAKRLARLEEVALDDAVELLRAFLKASGLSKDSAMVPKAKAAAALIGSFARIRASETNRLAIELQTQSLLGSHDRKRLA
jgi:hypothetical protein